MDESSMKQCNSMMIDDEVCQEPDMPGTSKDISNIKAPVVYKPLDKDDVADEFIDEKRTIKKVPKLKLTVRGKKRGRKKFGLQRIKSLTRSSQKSSSVTQLSPQNPEDKTKDGRSLPKLKIQLKRCDLIDAKDDKYSVKIEPSEASQSAIKRSSRLSDPKFAARHKAFLQKVNSATKGNLGVFLQSASLNQEPTPSSSKRKYFVEHDSKDETYSSKRLKTINCTKLNESSAKDSFCWICHMNGDIFNCDSCPRAFHLKCVSLDKTPNTYWICQECLLTTNGNENPRSSALHLLIEKDELRSFLKIVLTKMKAVRGVAPFLTPVDLTQFPTYTNYIVHPMDLKTMGENVESLKYDTLQSFLSDAKWIVHNCIIFNSAQSDLTAVSKSLLKACKREIQDVESCPDCYHDAYYGKQTKFDTVCRIPHLVVWAKLKGFPFWPAKAMRIGFKGKLDVRFFGSHDRAWVLCKNAYLFSEDPPFPQKTKEDLQVGLTEVKKYIHNVKKNGVEFRYAPIKVQFDPNIEMEQLKKMYPKITIQFKASNATYKAQCSASDAKAGAYEHMSIITLSDKKSKTQDHESQKSFETSSRSNSLGDPSLKLENNPLETSVASKDCDCMPSSPPCEVSSTTGLEQDHNQSGKICSSELLQNKCVQEKAKIVGAELQVTSGNHERFMKGEEISEKLSRLKGKESLSKTSDVAIEKDSSESSNFYCLALDELAQEEQENGYNQQNETQVLKRTDKEHQVMDKASFDGKTSTLNKFEESSSEKKNDSTLEKASMEEKEGKGLQYSLGLGNTGKTVITEATVSSEVDYQVDFKENLNDSKTRLEGVNGTENLNVSKLRSENIIVNSKDMLIKAKSDFCNNSSENINDEKKMQEEVKIAQDSESVVEKEGESGENQIFQADETGNGQSDETEDCVSDKTRFWPSDETGVYQTDEAGVCQTDEAGVCQITEARVSCEPNQIEVSETDGAEVCQREVGESILQNTKLAEPVCREDETEKSIHQEDNIEEAKLQSNQKEGKNSQSDKKDGVSKSNEKEENFQAKESEILNIQNSESTTCLEEEKVSKKLVSPTEASQKSLGPNKPVEKNTSPSVEAEKYPSNSNASEGDSGNKKNYSNQNEQLTQERSFPKISVKKNSELLEACKDDVMNTGNQADETSFACKQKGPSVTISKVTSSKIKATRRSESTKVESVNRQCSIFTKQGLAKFTTNDENTNSKDKSNTETSKSTNSNSLPFNGSSEDGFNKPREQKRKEISVNSAATDKFMPALYPKPYSTIQSRAENSSRNNSPCALGPTNKNILYPGPVSEQVGKMAGQIADLMKQSVLEAFREMEGQGPLESKVKTLQMEMDRLRWKHQHEMAEVKRGTDFAIAELRKSMEQEHRKLMQDIKKQAEKEKQKVIADVKKRQWCANCGKEAVFYCCWNTSYCDYPCQREHWSSHMSSCAQIKTNNSSRHNDPSPPAIPEDHYPRNFIPPINRGPGLYSPQGIQRFASLRGLPPNVPMRDLGLNPRLMFNHNGRFPRGGRPPRFFM